MSTSRSQTGQTDPFLQSAQTAPLDLAWYGSLQSVGWYVLVWHLVCEDFGLEFALMDWEFRLPGFGQDLISRGKSGA